MIWSYLKVGLRNSRKHKVFSFINIFGLAAAMSICLLILLMLNDQKEYDAFQVNKHRICRILTDGPEFRHPYATSPFPLAEELMRSNPAVESATHIIPGVGGDAIYQRQAVEMRGYFADPLFFTVFSFDLQQGDRATALAAPNSLVITADLGRRLFAKGNPIGKTVQFTDRGSNDLDRAEPSAPTPWGLFTITGVLADKPYKSHLSFDVLMSVSSMPALIADKKIADNRNDWSNVYNVYTYALIKPGKTAPDLDKGLARLAAARFAGRKETKGINLTGQRLTSISPGILLGNEPRISIPRIVYYFLGVLAFVIMISAAFNYTNLSVARALTRAKEIGIRKVNGAERKDLIFQFLSESVLTSLIALGLAILFLALIKSVFLHLWINQYLHFELAGSLPVYAFFLLIAVVLGLLAGLYPALYLSSFDPAKTLRSSVAGSPGKLPVRKILSVFQFVISLVFIISALLIFRQSRHFLHFQYEFNPSHIVNIELQSNDLNRSRQELASVPGVLDISACEYIPVTGRSEGISLKAVTDTGALKQLSALRADEHFLPVLGLRVVAGRNLESGKQASRYVVVNQAAVRELGYRDPRAILGQTLTDGADSASFLTVIGVVQDFHLGMDRDQVPPLVLQNRPSQFRFLNVRIASARTDKIILALQQRWKSIDPMHPLKYKFFDEQLASSSRGFFDMVAILGFFAFLAVTIACLGLLGMAVYTTERRRKEIGIRKTLGAPVGAIAFQLSREFLLVLLIAILIAGPVSYLGNNLWLQNFPNRVHFGLGTIGLGILAVVILGAITIGSQTLRAAKMKPVDAMKGNE